MTADKQPIHLRILGTNFKRSRLQPSDLQTLQLWEICWPSASYLNRMYWLACSPINRKFSIPFFWFLVVFLLPPPSLEKNPACVNKSAPSSQAEHLNKPFSIHQPVSWLGFCAVGSQMWLQYQNYLTSTTYLTVSLPLSKGLWRTAFTACLLAHYLEITLAINYYSS